MRNYTKLGFENSILVATIYLSGIMAPVIMFGLIIYTCLFEEDKFCRLSAKKATLFYILFSVLYGGLHAFDYVIRFFMTNLGDYNAVYNRISYALSFLELLFFLVMAIKAFLLPDEKPGVIDSKVDSMIEAISASMVKKSQSSADVEACTDFVFCSNCGNKMVKTSRYCNKCGTKMDSYTDI